MKKRRIKWIKLLLFVILAALAVSVGLMYQKITELGSQLSYLQDSTDILLADVDGLETNIAQTLEAETGLVEDYSIEITDMNFAAKTCEVAVSVIPKEYTDSTRLSVFFGTRECGLEKDGYEYTGTATLPLDEDFAGNLTFLFADGKKKNTEVYRNYEGVQHKLEQVLSGSMEKSPEYKDGTLTFTDTVEYALDGAGLYEFDSAELVVRLGTEELLCQALMELQEESGEEARGDLTDTEALSAEAGLYPISGMSGSVPLSLECQPERAGELRVFLRAVSAEGYRFEYDIFRCTLAEGQAEDGGELLSLDEESFDWTSVYTVYDRHGGKLVLE